MQKNVSAFVVFDQQRSLVQECDARKDPMKHKCRVQ